MGNETPHDLTIDELVQVTGWHPESLRRLARKGQLPGAYKLGGNWMICHEIWDKHRKTSRKATQEASNG